MTGATRVLALSFGELTLPIDCLDQETELRLRAQLRQGSAKPKVTVVPAPRDDQDVEGHAFAASLRSVLVHVRVGESGDAPVRVHFPTTQDADRFRRNLIAAGVLAGTLALGSVGVATLSNLQAQSAGGTAGTAQESVVQSVAPANVNVVLSGNPYSGKAAIEESLDMSSAVAATQPGVFVPGNAYSGKAAIEESLDMSPSVVATEPGVVMPPNAYSGKASVKESLDLEQPAAADESAVPGNPYSGKAAIEDSLK